MFGMSHKTMLVTAVVAVAAVAIVKRTPLNKWLAI